MNHSSGLSDQAFEQIKSMILKNQLKPGQLVKESQLQEMTGLGRTPVREAVLRLSACDLVSVHPRKGIEISKVSPRSLHDIFEIRSLLEPFILRTCHSRLSRERLSAFRDAFARFNTAEKLTLEESFKLAELDDRFHLTIVSSMENQYALMIMNIFLNKLTLIRSAVSFQNGQRFFCSNSEHIAIIDALLEEDIDTACRLLQEHISVSYEEAVKILMLTN